MRKSFDYRAFVFPDLLFSLKIASDKAQNKPQWIMSRLHSGLYAVSKSKYLLVVFPIYLCNEFCTVWPWKMALEDIEKRFDVKIRCSF